MGTPEFAVPSLEHLVINDYQVVAVYTQPDRPAGRGRHPAPSPVKRAAMDLGLPVVQPERLKDSSVVQQLAAYPPDVIVVAAFGQILPASLLALPPKGCINIHPSLLPRFRGASPVAAAILAGENFAGISIMLMDAGLDTGPVLAQAQVGISRRDTTGSLTAKLSLVAAHLLLEVLPRWVRGEITPRPQPEAAASYTEMLSREDSEIDWRQSAADIWLKVRAFQPWPGCHTFWQGRQLKIIEALPLPVVVVNDARAGQVIPLKQEGFGVATGNGVLEILKVQLEGKRAMSAAEFRRGQPGLIGAVLPSGK